MADFNPQPNEEITIGGQVYRVSPHPAVPVFAFGQEGRKAHVFQLSDKQGNKYALKRFKLAYRVPELIQVNDELAQFARWNGLEVANRRCLTKDQYGDVLSRYPDLEYAVLMPWITGSTWYDLLIAMTPLTRLEAITFAKGMVDVLAGLEEAGLAHCDIAAANVILNPSTGRAHLIDIEDMYAPGFPKPAAVPAGTDGYAHKTAAGGLWGPNADRFAGAIIVSEMLAWHDQRIRKASEEEHYFSAGEMQQDTPDYQLMRAVLADFDPELADLFDQAWFSETLDDAPPMRAWKDILEGLHHRVRVAEVASEWRPLTMPGGSQPETEEDPTPPPAPEPEPAAELPPHPTDPAPAPAEEDEDEEDTQPATPSLAQPQTVQTPMPPPAAPAPVVVDTGDAGSPVIEWRPLAGMGAAASTASPGDEEAEDQQTTTPMPAPTDPDVEFEPLDLGNIASMSGGEPEEDVDFEPLASPVPDEAGALPRDAVEEPEPLLTEDFDTLDEPDPTHDYEDALEVMEDDYPYHDDDQPFDEDEPLPTSEQPVLPPEPEPVDQTQPEDPVEIAEELGFASAEPAPLPTPQLDYNEIDRLGRPHLVWTEAYGATVYLLQESKDPGFSSPREFELEASGDTRWNPAMPRTGRLFYRIKAIDEEHDRESDWSEVVGVRVGER